MRTEPGSSLIAFRFRLRWYLGLSVGIGWYDGCLFVMLGPVQLEVEPR